MTTQEERLLHLVHFRIDEAYGLGTQPSLEPDQVLFELNAAARQVMRAAPRSLIGVLAVNRANQANSWVNANMSIAYSSGAGVIGQVPLSSVLRVLRVKCLGWVKPVHSLVSTEQTIYQQQFNRFQAATVHNPVAALIDRVDSSGGIIDGSNAAVAVHCFPVPKDTPGPFQQFTVLPVLSANQLTIEHPDLEDAVVYVTAARVIRSERGDAAKAAEYEASGMAAMAQAALDYPGAPIVEG